MEQASLSYATLNITMEDMSVLKYIRSIIRHTKGVVKVHVTQPKVFDVTQTNSYKRAMEDKSNGRVTEWDSLDSFFSAMEK